ncbi:short transient receptor potential channel 2, partial [Plakobranchus ocellatus]
MTCEYLWCGALKARGKRSKLRFKDNVHKAINIVSGCGSKKWLSDLNDRSGRIEVILQLEESCQLAYIDIVDFSSDIGVQKWDRLQIICCQPFRKDVQLGISFIRLKSSEPVFQSRLKGSGSCKQVELENKSLRDVSSIKHHFFQKAFSENSERANSVAELKQRLLRISGSTEHGSQHEQSLPRTAKLVLKASENSAKKIAIPPVSSKHGLFSNHTSKRQSVPFFTSFSNFSSPDLRHKFEKRKKRKLTVEEKRKFSSLCEQFICTFLDGQAENNSFFVPAVSHQETPRVFPNEALIHSETPHLNQHWTLPKDSNKKCKHQSLHTPSASLPIKSSLQSGSRVLTKMNKVGSTCGKELRIESSTPHANTDAAVITEDLPLISPIVRQISVSSSTESLRSMPDDIDTENTKITTAAQMKPPEIYASCNRADCHIDETLTFKDKPDTKEEANALSAVSYNDDDVEEEKHDANASSSHDSSPDVSTPGKNKERHNLENVKKSYEQLFNITSKLQEPTCQQISSYTRKRKLNFSSTELLQRLDSEISVIDFEDDNDGQQGITSGFPLGQTGNSLTKDVDSNKVIVSCVTTPDGKMAFAGLAPNIVSPKTSKGKIYRMLTSQKQGSTQVEQRQISTNGLTKHISADKDNVKRTELVAQNKHLSVHSPQLARPVSDKKQLSIIEATQEQLDGDAPGKPILYTSERGRGRTKSKRVGRSQKTSDHFRVLNRRSKGDVCGIGGRPGNSQGGGMGKCRTQNSSNNVASGKRDVVFCDKCY